MTLIFIIGASTLYIVFLLFVISLCRISAQSDQNMEKMRIRELLNSNTGDIVFEEIDTEDTEPEEFEETREAYI